MEGIYIYNKNGEWKLVIERQWKEEGLCMIHFVLGYIVGKTYKCVGQCQAEQCSIDGIYLTNCKDTIYLIDFGLVAVKDC